MNYNYNNISYSKRPLTEDIALYAAANDFSLVETKSPEFERLTKPYKLGELAAQQDACPIQKAEGLKEKVDFLKKHFEGFRIRNAQLSGIIVADGNVSGIDEQTALYLAACGSIAVIAKEYGADSDRSLLSKGILPLISAQTVPVGAFILIRNIRRDIRSGRLDAYIVHTDGLEEIDLRIAEYTSEELEPILK